jgi:hypothetical protein
MRPMNDDPIANGLENIDLRLGRVEQILPGLATKDDLRLAIAPLATKDALGPLATREDLTALATQAELRALATKEDLAALATKAELRALATKEDLAALATKEELTELDANLRAEITAEGVRLRRHMDVLIEGQRSDIQLLAEHLSAVMTRLADG